MGDQFGHSNLLMPDLCLNVAADRCEVRASVGALVNLELIAGQIKSQTD